MKKSKSLSLLTGHFLVCKPSVLICEHIGRSKAIISVQFNAYRTPLFAIMDMLEMALPEAISFRFHSHHSLLLSANSSTYDTMLLTTGFNFEEVTPTQQSRNNIKSMFQLHKKMV